MRSAKKVLFMCEENSSIIVSLKGTIVSIDMTSGVCTLHVRCETTIASPEDKKTSYGVCLTTDHEQTDKKGPAAYLLRLTNGVASVTLSKDCYASKFFMFFLSQIKNLPHPVTLIGMIEKTTPPGQEAQITLTEVRAETY